MSSVLGATIPSAKLLAVSCVGLLLSLGLCGSSVWLAGSSAPLADKFFFAGALVLGLSVLGIAVSICWMLLDGFRASTRK
jgi:hypothetical protein